MREAKISDDFAPLKTRRSVFANPVCAMQRFHFKRENFPRANLEKTFARTRRDAREARKSSSHFAPKSLSFKQESLGGKGKNRSRTSNKNERARTSSPFCDARFMLIFIVREKRHKNYSIREREREKSARKRSIKAYHLCSTKENVVSTMTVKRERKNKGSRSRVLR